ncbi:MAG: sigma-70 family RNA polymerase sigma factor [Acidobacteria bacterium]|nr:MAG: sigma-70 family RNA polymerase sigma factor [Acidobacteriota bacterium]
MGNAIHLFALAMEPETKALAHGLRRRDPDLLAALIAQYEYRLFRYLIYLTGSEDVARDIFQETWLRVLDRGHQYDGVSRFDSWLFSIARHLVIDSSRRRKMDSLDALLDPAHDAGAKEPRSSESASPLVEYENRELAARISSMLGRLPAVYREVLLLRFQEDLSLKEIAGIIRAPLATVKSRLYRGLGAARELLEELQL